MWSFTKEFAFAKSSSSVVPFGIVTSNCGIVSIPGYFAMNSSIFSHTEYSKSEFLIFSSMTLHFGQCVV